MTREEILDKAYDSWEDGMKKKVIPLTKKYMAVESSYEFMKLTDEVNRIQKTIDKKLDDAIQRFIYGKGT